ncbi:MAG TPA: dihydrofolate reductase family protein [Propionibacteriaceae bacterium]|jgi:dihydrofolate reductase|nr:dihydrofolate reductase family protein [Propionibacteriaceae bacterium]
MGKLIVNTFTSLDGVMQAPGMPEEDREGGFDQGGWQVPYFDEESGQVMTEAITGFDALLLGRKTYEIFAGYWPYAPADDPIATRLNEAPKYVASRTLDALGWNNSTLLKGDIADEVARLTEAYDEIHTSGSGNLVQSLMKNELVDQYNVWVYPVLLGGGKRLFGEGTIPTALRLVESRAFGNGAVLLTYEPTGKPEYGSTALSR